MWALDHTSDMWSIDSTTCNTATTAEFEQLVHQHSTSARETKDLAEQLQRLQVEAQEEVIRRQSTKADRTRELAQVWQTAASIRGLSNSTTDTWVMLLNTMEENEVFCARDDGNRKTVVFVDDGSEVTLIRRGIVQPHWEKTMGNRVRILGVGANQDGTKAEATVTVPLRLRGSMEPIGIAGYVVPDNTLPDGVDILVGKPVIKSLGIKPDSQNMRLEFQQAKSASGIPMVINTMPLGKQLDILAAAPLRVLDICGGGSFSWQTLTDMGYSIDLYDAIEKDTIARGIARMHSHEGVTHLAPHNLMKMNTKLVDTYTDIIATPECAPWSRASESPKGFEDDRARLFERAADIISDQRRRNRHLNVIFENTEIHPKLVKRGDADKQEELLEGKFYVSNACDLGGMSSRPRRIHSNMATSAQLLTRKPAPSCYALRPNWLPVKHPMFCLLSKKDTWNPQTCVLNTAMQEMLQGKSTIDSCTQKGHMRAIDGDERDAYMGHTPGISALHMAEDGTVSNVSESYRRELMGKGLHEAHIWAYFNQRDNT